MKKKRFIKDHGSRLAVLAAALALLLFIPAGMTTHAVLRTFLIVSIAILLCGGAVLLYLSNAYNAKGKEVHYFLYDRRRKKLLARDAINEQTVADAIDYYLSEFTQDPLSLLQEIPKPLRDLWESEPHFRPLAMYRVLHLLSKTSQSDILPLFASADTRAVNYLCRALDACGDTELADYIYRLKKNAEREAGRIPLFFKKNERRFATRGLRYIEQNFDRFYVSTSRFS